MTDAERAKFDGQIAMVMELVKVRFDQGGLDAAVQSLREAYHDCKNQDAARSAGILLNDYSHLVDGGCHRHVAMMITLTQPKDLA